MVWVAELPRRMGWQLTEATRERASETAETQRVVALSNRDLEDAKRLLGLLIEEAPKTIVAFPSSRSDLYQRDRLVADARRVLARRRRREERFGRGISNEPAWEMLLILYISEGRERQTMQRLAEQSGYPRATAFRWIEWLEHRGLVERIPHPTDRRAFFVELTGKGRREMDEFLAEMP